MATLKEEATRCRDIPTRAEYSAEIKHKAEAFNERLNHLLKSISKLEAKKQTIKDNALAGETGGLIAMRKLQSAELDLMIDLRSHIAGKQAIAEAIEEFKEGAAQTSLRALLDFDAALKLKLGEAGLCDSELVKKAIQTNAEHIKLDKLHDMATGLKKCPSFTDADANQIASLQAMIESALS